MADIKDYMLELYGGDEGTLAAIKIHVDYITSPDAAMQDGEQVVTFNSYSFQ